MKAAPFQVCLFCISFVFSMSSCTKTEEDRNELFSFRMVENVTETNLSWTVSSSINYVSDGWVLNFLEKLDNKADVNDDLSKEIADPLGAKSWCIIFSENSDIIVWLFYNGSFRVYKKIENSTNKTEFSRQIIHSGISEELGKRMYLMTKDEFPNHSVIYKSVNEKDIFGPTGE